MDIAIVLIIVAVAVVLFATEKLSMDVVAILVLGSLTGAFATAAQSMCMPVLFDEIARDLNLNLVQIGLVWGIGALAGHFSDYGIDDDFIEQVRAKVTQGTSALFLLSSEVTVDKVSDAFKDMQMELVQSNLSAEQEAKLRQDFGEE